MQKYLFFILLCFINSVYSCSQTTGKFHRVSGMFICRADQHLIYMENEDDDGEYPTYTIKSINLNTNEKVVVDEQVSSRCVKMSDKIILYTKGEDILSWDLELKRKAVYYKTDKDMNLIGLCYNINTSNILYVQINYKTNEMFFSILNNRKQIIFHQKIEINDMELEGIMPVLEALNDFFVLSVQDKLCIIDSKKLELKLVSSKCDNYALYKGQVIYYKFVTDEKTEGYSFDLITGENEKLDNLLNDKIFNCSEKSLLFTANIDENFVPTYFICNKPYLLVDGKWQLVSDTFIYKDEQLIVKMVFEKNIINDNCFQWESR